MTIKIFKLPTSLPFTSLFIKQTECIEALPLKLEESIDDFIKQQKFMPYAAENFY